MLEFARKIVETSFNSAAAVLLFLLPLFAIALGLRRRRRRFHAEVMEPFTEIPLRPPGESLRLKIDELKEKFDGELAITAMCGTGAAMAVASAPAPQKPMIIAGMGLGVLFIYYRSWRIMSQTQRELWDYELGFTGERLVGEELNQLMASGFRVFHDVPFDKYNIDHVLVGPSGVYAVETKSPRKKAAIKGVERATVFSNGTDLQFPTWTNTRFIEQARRNAESLSEWLTEATGVPVVVSAILTLPGWRIERLATKDVNVLRPDEIKRSFPARPKQPLNAQQIEQIAYQLRERCRTKKDPAPN